MAANGTVHIDLILPSHPHPSGAPRAAHPPSILLASPLMAAARHLGRPAIVQASASRTWGEVHAMAMELAARLPGTGVVVNLCESRLGFLVTWLAALRSGRPMWLPPSAARGDCVDALGGRAAPCVVVDDPDDREDAWPAGMHRVVRGAQASCAHPTTASAELSWQPCWDEPAAVLHTSGSTGRPTAHTKTLLQLALGALALGERLWPGGLPHDGEHLLSSVVPAHMFGFEASVMLPLVYGLPVIDRRPRLAADLEDAENEWWRHTAASSGESATQPSFLWIATPMHLRSLVRSGTTMRHCSGIVSSTMPLSAEIALQAEASTGSPVLEVYGSTETGALATRRTACDTEWSPLAGVFTRPAADSLREANRGVAFGTHFDSPIRLADELAISASGSFTLLGRDGDLLKIGGHRASLASLNLLLLEMPGLRDGVLFMPNASSGQAADALDTLRLCLVYSSDELDRAQIERWWRQRVAAVFMPRVFIRVDRVPRNDIGKASRAELDALHARWWRGQGRFDVSVPPDHPALPGHFPGRPVVPGALLLDAMLDGMAARTGRTVAGLEQARFTAACLPGDRVTVRFEVEADRCRMSAAAIRSGAEVALVQVVARCAPEASPKNDGPASAPAASTVVPSCRATRVEPAQAAPDTAVAEGLRS